MGMQSLRVSSQQAEGPNDKCIYPLVGKKVWESGMFISCSHTHSHTHISTAVLCLSLARLIILYANNRIGNVKTGSGLIGFRCFFQRWLTRTAGS